MARKLSPTEFYKELAHRCNGDPERVQFIWENFCEMMSDELLMYGSLFLPFLGEMKLQARGGKKLFMPVSPRPEDKGKVKEVYMEPYHKVQFLPSDTLKEIINGDGTPRALINRQREIYRKMRKEMQEQEKQFEYMKRAENACAEMRAKKEAKLARKEQQKLAEAERKQKAKESLKRKRAKDYENREQDFW